MASILVSVRVRSVVSRSVGLAHLIRQDDGTSTGVWGVFTLKSAFQPIFAFRDGKLEVAAFEGLIRPFRDAEQMSPYSFFNSIPPIDRLHIETLTRTLHLLNAAACLPEAASIFVNFDPSVFTDRKIADTALRETRLVLHEAGISASRVVCEVTEQKSASAATLFNFVEALRANGFKIAVDDFGADESDINRIRDLKPDIVKFDAQWIVKLMDSGPGVALLRAMVDRFAQRGILTVFEGIEEPWQLEVAEKANAAMVQGYALARPEIVPHGFDVFRVTDLPSMAARPTEAQSSVERRPMREESIKPPAAHGKAFGRRTGAAP